MFSAANVFAQEVQKKINREINRCGTMDAIKHRLETDPAFRAEYEKGLQDYEASKSMSRADALARTASTSTLTGPVTIPVVFHIVLPNPWVITEADIDYVLARLNSDYSGLNPDTANTQGTPFAALRGHSLLRFTRAKRDLNGNYSTGVERKVGNGAIGTSDPQNIKKAVGGLPAWDYTKFYNVWVGDGSATGLLGIASNIGPQANTSDGWGDGVCIDYKGFAHNPCYSYVGVYDLGRTLVHEVGHTMGNYHPFDNGCNTNDFAQISGGNCTFPANLLSPDDDVPVQSAATTNCPTVPTTSGCAAAPLPPGKMYQNYMDYTYDACYSMFSAGTVARMHYVLENCRAGYLTTPNINYPTTMPALDASLETIVNPGGQEFVQSTCTSTTYTTPTCPGSFTPRVRVQNRGTTTLTTVKVGFVFNGTAQTQQSYSMNLAIGKDTVVAWPTGVTLIAGTNTLKFYTASPNGGTDAVASNDTLSTTLTIAAGGITLPVTQNFTGVTAATFPGTNFTLTTSGTYNWVFNAAGNGNVNSAFIDNYDNATVGATADLKTKPFSPGTADSVTISFDAAYKYYSAGFSDTLKVLISTDCGTTYTQLFNRGGSQLGGTRTTAYTTPAAADWKNYSVTIFTGVGSPYHAGPLIVAFRDKNGYGNNMFLDNINISPKVARDMTPTTVVAPITPLCSGSFTPSVTVKNNGADATTKFRVSYYLDGVVSSAKSVTVTTPLATLTSVTVPFPLAPVAGLTGGTHTITFFTDSVYSATGFGDLLTANDTLTYSFVVKIPATSPFIEGFEGPWTTATSTYAAPAGWNLLNPDADVTWVKQAPGNNSAYSAFFDNYDWAVNGEIDRLLSPPVQLISGADSLVVSFDVAYKAYPGSNDRLRLYVSTNCGTTFGTNIFSQAGTTLSGGLTSTAAYINPASADWKTKRVAVSAATYTTGSVVVAFENYNDYGNNMFLDNINIKGVYGRDIALNSIIVPGSVLCNATAAPVVVVKNVGTKPDISFTVSYSVDGGTVTPLAVTPPGNLAPNASDTLTLAALSGLSAGSHTITVYTSNLVATTGSGDVNASNDTLRQVFYIVGTVAAPLVEGFEGTTFPPTGWARVNPDNSTTWARANVGYQSSHSAYMRGATYTSANSSIDELYTPRITYSGIDSLFMSFRVAAATASYPGSTAIPLDTLRVLITADCGSTFTTIYKKWGIDLQTLSDPNTPTTSEFIPSSDGQWRLEKLNLFPWVTGSPIQAVFRTTSNHENDIYIDSVQVYSKTLPAALKNNGFLIAPNPVTSTVVIQHYLAPTDLRGIGLYNAVGQRMAYWSFNGDAPSYIPIDMSRFSAGVYTFKLDYNSKTISQKIIKL